VHGAFVLFVGLGGLLTLCWRRLAWAHAPAVCWGVAIECSGATCPLTPLENWLRTRSGRPAYAGGFVQQYVEPVLYPAGLTGELQIVLGALALAVNVPIYWWLVRRARRPTDP
jgi:hypothetical protein